MKPTAKILKFKGKELQSKADVRAALLAILEDLRFGDVTATEAEPIQKDINTRMKEIKSGKLEAAVKSFFAYESPF